MNLGVESTYFFTSNWVFPKLKLKMGATHCHMFNCHHVNVNLAMWSTSGLCDNANYDSPVIENL